MPVHKYITLIGTSPESWEQAAASAVKQAEKTLSGLRIAEVKELDMQIEKGKPINYRAKITVSFRVYAKPDQL